MNNRMNFIFDGAKVKRFHTEDVLIGQSVAEHSFGVAWFCHLINPQARKELLLAALAHDLAEQVTGDIPSPLKKVCSSVKHIVNELEEEYLEDHSLSFNKQLTPEEQRTLKFADMLDGMMFCVRERKVGNLSIVPVYVRFLDYLMSYKPSAQVTDIVNAIDNEWRKVNDGK